MFITVADRDKSAATGIATQLHDLGFKLIATRGTAKALDRMGIPARTINKLGEGSPHVVDAIERGEVDLVINTPVGTGARTDGYEIRAAAVAHRIPCITTMSGGIAAVRAIAAAAHGEPDGGLAAGALRRVGAGFLSGAVGAPAWRCRTRRSDVAPDGQSLVRSLDVRPARSGLLRARFSALRRDAVCGNAHRCELTSPLHRANKLPANLPDRRNLPRQCSSSA